ncbi:MAG: MotA/TolQ/ExbB proton channel family protein [Burkholderiaceae bacterium]|nr:MotA/TolQ/ExbB proton channel family protein [Burkholderiaceae bacterium]
MNNAFGLHHLWTQGDFVTHFVALVLLFLSVVTWVILISRIWGLRNIKRLKNELDGFWRARSFDEGLASLSNHALNPFYKVAKTANEASAHHLNQRSNHRELLQTLNYSEWMAFLASTGATAPFIGLFGTVWGIYHALIAISSSGSAQIDQVAGPIGEALIMTAFGLAVAIPAVLGYNAINRSNKLVMADLNRFANDLLAYFVTGARVPDQE